MHINRLVLVSTGYHAPDPAWAMAPHLHPYHELIVPLRGKMRVASDGQFLEAAAGDVLLYPARVTHAERSDEAAPVETLFLSFTEPSARLRKVIMAHDGSGRIRQLIRWIHEDKHSSAPQIEAEHRILLQAIVAEFLRNLRHREDPLVQGIRQYIQDHVAEPLSLALLARQARQSKYHFLRTYKALTGRTPMDDVRRLRANFARELILGTGLPLKEIAPRAGLGNEYAMSRIFRRYFNLPPGKLRRTHPRITEKAFAPRQSRPYL